VDLEGGYVGGLDNQESSNGGEVVDVLEVWLVYYANKPKFYVSSFCTIPKQQMFLE
jgi:hypothetical protein